MKLVVHIGTHKTGTTALQLFLGANRQALAARGVCYASAGLNANPVANAIATDALDDAREFFAASVREAQRSDAEALLVSAENFYCMALVGAVLSERPEEAAARDERLYVQRLREVIPAEVTHTTVVGCFRRPDRFAESLYNQRVKYERYHQDFDAYLSAIAPMLDYHRIASVWADVFGRESCRFRTYEAVADRLEEDFLREAVGVTDTTGFQRVGSRENERISRDVLELKRELNRELSASEQHRAYKITCMLDALRPASVAEPECHQQHLSPARRAELLERLAPETDALVAAFSLLPFPALAEDADSWSAYGGLTEHRRRELLREYRRQQTRLAVRSALGAKLRPLRRRAAHVVGS